MNYLKFFPLILVFTSTLALAEDAVNSRIAKTDANGTTIINNTSGSESLDMAGTSKSVKDSKTVIDPKGPFNKKTSTTHVEHQVKPNGDYTASKTVKRTNGADEETTLQKSTSNHWTNKGKTTKTVETKTLDPAGLANKHTVEITKEVESNPNGLGKKTLTKKVDGTTVSESIESDINN